MIENLFFMNGYGLYVWSAFSFTLVSFLKVGASSGRSWRLSWEGFGGYVGRCWLQDHVFWLSSAMLWHLGAKMAS